MSEAGGTTGTYIGTTPAASSIDYLIPILRLHIGDITSTSYRYMDEWLRIALLTSVKELQRWWSNKYLIDSDNNVYRNTNYLDFTLPESDGVIQDFDEKPIILLASIIIKKGELESTAWGSWKDYEISYSNIEGSRSKSLGLERDWNELTSIMKPPIKRLARGRKQSILENI